MSDTKKQEQDFTSDVDALLPKTVALVKVSNIIYSAWLDII